MWGTTKGILRVYEEVDEFRMTPLSDGRYSLERLNSSRGYRTTGIVENEEQASAMISNLHRPIIYLKDNV